MSKADSWKGPQRKDLEPLKDWILREIENNGEVRWTYLWNNRISDLRSPKHLHKCLEHVMNLCIFVNI